MKQKIPFLATMLFIASFASAQSYSSDFNWLNFGNESSITVHACGEPIEITFSTPTVDHSSVGFPQPTTIPGAVIPVTVSFSRPVSNLSLLMEDFDDYISNGAYSENADSFLDENGNTRNPVSVVSTAGDIDLDLPAGVVRPAVEQTQDNSGWVNWTGSLSSITFNYNRDWSTIQNGGLRLDSLRFDCDGCGCDRKRSDLTDYSLAYPANGRKPVSLAVNSFGEPVSKLVISVSNYNVRTSSSCLFDLSSDLNLIGKIVSSSISDISGVDPVIGSSAIYPAGSNEIIYNFETAVPINATVDFDLFFPTSPCKRVADYCIKTTFYNERCTACDYYTCNTLEPSDQSQSVPRSNTIPTATSSEFLEGPVKFNVENEIKIWPNPVKKSELLTILVPEGFTKIEVIGSAGQVKKSFDIQADSGIVEFQLEGLSPGVYFISATNGRESLTSKLVIAQ